MHKKGNLEKVACMCYWLESCIIHFVARPKAEMFLVLSVRGSACIKNVFYFLLQSFFSNTGTPLLEQISNWDYSFKVEKMSYFLISIFFSWEIWLWPSKSYKISEKKVCLLFNFYFQNFPFHFKSQLGFLLTFKAY